MNALPRRPARYVPKLKSERPVHYALYVFARHTKSVLIGIEKRTHALVSFANLSVYCRRYLVSLRLLLPPLDDVLDVATARGHAHFQALGRGRQKRAYFAGTKNRAYFAGTTNRAHFGGTYCISHSAP